MEQRTVKKVAYHLQVYTLLKLDILTAQRKSCRTAVDDNTDTGSVGFSPGSDLKLLSKC